MRAAPPLDTLGVARARDCIFARLFAPTNNVSERKMGGLEFRSVLPLNQITSRYTPRMSYGTKSKYDWMSVFGAEMGMRTDDLGRSAASRSALCKTRRERRVSSASRRRLFNSHLREMMSCRPQLSAFEKQ